MYIPKLLTLSLLIFLLSLSLSSSSAAFPDSSSDEIEELLALDEESETLKSPETEVLAKAQRIVIELNHESSKRIIEENEFVIVLGYAPWCERSAEMMPRFAEAVMEMRGLGSKVLMAKIDGERFSKAAEAIGIKGFPTLLLFVNGSAQTYPGGFTSEEIVIWARKKTGEPVIRINSETGATEFLKKHPTFVVGVFDKFEGSNYEEFLKAAALDNEIQFVETSSFEVASVLFPDIKLNSWFLGLVKSEPERFTAFEGIFEMEKILEFVDINKFPLVTTVTELNSVRVYSSPIKLQDSESYESDTIVVDVGREKQEDAPEREIKGLRIIRTVTNNLGRLQQCLSFTSPSKVYVFADVDDFKNLHDSLQNIARKFKSEVMILYTDIKEENLAKPFLTMFGLEDSEETVVAAFDNKIGSKYLLESDPIPSKIEEFCLGLKRGFLMPFYKSQPIPNNKETNILTVVGKTFSDLVLNSPKNVFLEVLTPWCMNCETMAKNVEKLEKHFKGMDNLIFARIDLSANEHPNLQVDDYPTLLLYLSGNKNNPIKLSNKSSLKGLAELINKNLKNQRAHATKDEL